MSIEESHQVNSPRGVADIFIEDNKFRKGGSEHSSAGWTDEESVGSDSFYQSPLLTKFLEEYDVSERIRNEINQVEFRIEWLKGQSARDKIFFQEKLQVAKAEFRAELERDYGIDKNLEHDPNEKIHNQLVTESTRMIRFVREDNMKIRKEMDSLKEKSEQLHREGRQLEDANVKANEALEGLKKQFKKIEHTHEKLNNKCDRLKHKLKTYKVEYGKREAFFHSEITQCDIYEKCIAKTLTMVEKGKKKDWKLIEAVLQEAQDGSERVAKARHEQLDLAGLEREWPVPRRSMVPDFLLDSSDSESESDSRSSISYDSDWDLF